MAEVRADSAYIFIPVCQFCMHPDDSLTSVDKLYCSDKCKESDEAHLPMTQEFRITASRMVTLMQADASFNTLLSKYINGEDLSERAALIGLTPDEFKKPYLFNFAKGRFFATLTVRNLNALARNHLEDDKKHMKECAARVETLMGRIGEDLTTILVSTILREQFGLFLFKAKLLDIEKKEN